LKTLTILGSTGSIGTQTLEILHCLPERHSIGFLTTNRNTTLLEEQTKLFSPQGVVIGNEEAYKEFKRTTSFHGTILCGAEGLCEAAADVRNSLVMSALVGFSGVQPTLAALQQGIPVALANKETLVSAGTVITEHAHSSNTPIIAVDSEHSAILQCVVGENLDFVEKMILTASGGPFRTLSQDEFHAITPQKALRHPNWSMGNKITIDSATLMNKGFEVMEARWLFDIPAHKIDVVVHPQSIIHSMVQFCDGSVKAQLGLPSMKIPILYALSYPERFESDFPRMDITEIQTLTFEKPDYERFPCLQLAFDALEQSGNAPAVLNAANEVAVAGFLSESLAFQDIPVTIEQTLQKIPFIPQPSLEDIVASDREARNIATTLLSS
jgi:1-deoxy-D-xylulose-5-phosphate reductoisomerase